MPLSLAARLASGLAVALLAASCQSAPKAVIGIGFATPELRLVVPGKPALAVVAVPGVTFARLEASETEGQWRLEWTTDDDKRHAARAVISERGFEVQPWEGAGAVAFIEDDATVLCLDGGSYYAEPR